MARRAAAALRGLRLGGAALRGGGRRVLRWRGPGGLPSGAGGAPQVGALARLAQSL